MMTLEIGRRNNNKKQGGGIVPVQEKRKVCFENAFLACELETHLQNPGSDDTNTPGRNARNSLA